MKFSTVVSTLLVASAAAFAPATTERASTSLNMDRRSAVMGVVAAAGVVALPQMASADGAVSKATVQRARFNYGSRIIDLKSAVAAGDFAAVAAEKNAFVLFNSGAYPGSKNKAQKTAAIAATNGIFSAIRSKDKGALKKAFDEYVALTDIATLADDASGGQGYCGDFDYRVRTKQASIYVR